MSHNFFHFPYAPFFDESEGLFIGLAFLVPFNGSFLVSNYVGLVAMSVKEKKIYSSIVWEQQHCASAPHPATPIAGQSSCFQPNKKAYYE